jgi:hypothetical protein
MNFHLHTYSNPVPAESAPLSQGHAHLSDDQIDDHLIGDLAAAPAAHLAACSHCSSRVAEAAGPLTSFQNVTMAWSERRSATLPIPDLSQQRPLWQRHMAFATACFGFVIGIAVINTSHEVELKTAELQTAQPQSSRQVATERATTQTPVLTETASAPREAQITADNHMLKAIDKELSTSTDSPASLGIEPVSDRSSRPPATASVQD